LVDKSIEKMGFLTMQNVFVRSVLGGVANIVSAIFILSLSFPATAQTSQYILEAGDQIYIQVFDEPDLTMQATVGQSGAINYSYLGTIQVAGQTPEQLTQSITDKLRDGYLKNPSVNITVQKYRSFFVDGEVNRPGSYGYEPGLTLAKAVSLAGGMTDRASRRKIFLTREIDGEKKSYRVDMSQTVEPGDIITIREGFF
jgi:polysaccharide export outer membrane protein